ncbi:MAG: prepilin-type N-terminal cleavage/methylation domain-containing protein [Candidatus Riflebacteria bacterium]
MIRRGFTLIELLVVITILAILAGAALPYVQNYVAESRIAKAKTDLEEIARALAVYETREGEYAKTTVEDLTGRYLNKAPIDPWGAQYVIDTLSGTVYSTGPDRADDSAGKYDNIIVPYQPPLALVSAKWVDKNQTGAVDIKNVNDEIHLTFSRKLNTTVLANNTGITDNITFTRNATAVTTSLLSAIVTTASGILVANKTVVYPINNVDLFVAGRDNLKVNDGQAYIVDRTTPTPSKCISGQSVLILAQ